MAFHHSPKIVTNGLVLCLDAANRKSYSGTGTTWTDLAGTNNGTLTNGPTFNSANGGSIVFDGTDDYASIASTNSIQPTNISIGVWLKLNILLASQNSAYPLIIDKYDLATNKGYNLMFDRGSNTLIWRVFNGSTNGLINITSASSLFGTTWQYIVATFDSLVLNTYLNGRVAATPVSFATTISYNNETLYIGSFDGSGNFINGSIASVQIYNRALTAAEVLQNYNATKGRFGL